MYGPGSYDDHVLRHRLCLIREEGSDSHIGPIHARATCGVRSAHRTVCRLIGLAVPRDFDRGGMEDYMRFDTHTLAICSPFDTQLYQLYRNRLQFLQ